MQTILGASGQIGRELASSLKQNFTRDIRLVSRNPQAVNDSDELFRADLLDAEQTLAAVAGSQVVYLTAGLPMNTGQWAQQFPLMMANVIAACRYHQTRLVYFDNTYMYPQNSQPLTEHTAFAPVGEKGRVRAAMAQQLLDAMQQQQLEAMICRAPEFYGPGMTQSITNSMVIQPLLSGQTAKVLLRDDTLRSLIYTPDASRAMALLGNSDDAYQQSWHLPCDDNRLTYRQFVTLAAEVFGVAADYRVLPGWQLAFGRYVNRSLREITELLPRYKADNLFIADKFRSRFPQFEVTSYRQGLTAMLEEFRQSASAIRPN